MNQGLRASSFSFAGLVTCVGISVLLISPALAQVNGPGESPANLFDTVLNLPGDEAVITGINLESIGGVPGQTIQLNLTDGGAIGNFFDARLGGEVNISGGMIGFNIDADPGSELNISGGSFDGLIVLDEGVANISGGNLGGPIIAESGSTVDISGGEIGFVGSVSRFFGSFTAEPGSAVNISGGTFGAGFSTRGSVELIGGEQTAQLSYSLLVLVLVLVLQANCSVPMTTFYQTST